VDPPPVQDVAFVELHERVEDCPELILVGPADSEAVVADGGVVKGSGGAGRQRAI
jgi:hypothetical protein